MNSSSTIVNGIGQPVRRKEDFRLLTGKGSYADDLVLPGLAHAVIRALAAMPMRASSRSTRRRRWPRLACWPC